MKASQTLKPNENSIYKIKTNLEKVSTIISRKPEKILKRGRQPYSQKLKFFPLEDKEISISNINLIPKKISRTKNNSSHKLFIKNVHHKNEDKKQIDDNDSGSEYSNSYSRYYKMTKYYGDCKTNNSYNYPYHSKKEVGLYSSEEENSSENSLIEEENFGMEIEKILIEIYNKNISNIHNNKKPKPTNNQNIPGQDHLKSNFEKYDDKCNLLILKVLSNKIKELIQKYKEKIYEIQDIKEIYEQQKSALNSKYYNKKNTQIDINNINGANNNNNNKVNSKLNNTFDSETFTNNKPNSILSKLKYCSSSMSQKKLLSYENIYENFISNRKMLLQVKDELIEYGIPKTLLKELKNIKHTLIISSSEIENVFEYPLSLLKDDNNNLIQFSLEKMQLEEFWKILLKDDFISSLISQIKIINSQLKISEITELLNQVSDDEISHQNEMTKFDDFINNKLKLDNSVITCNNNSTSSFLRECNEISAKAFTLTSASSVESFYDRNEVNNNIADLDELVKYINEETETKKNKKNKNRKNKKNVNKNNNPSVQNSIEGLCKNIESIIDYINEEKSRKSTNGNNSNEEGIYVTDKNVEDFKKEIESFSVPSYMTQKIEVNLSEEFLDKLGREFLVPREDGE